MPPDNYQWVFFSLSDEQRNIANQRLYVEPSTTNVTMDTACVTTNPPATREFHILVRAGTYCINIDSSQALS